MVVLKSQIEFTSDDGVANKIVIAHKDDTLHADTNETLILCVPAMGVAAKQYSLLIEEFANCGMSAACFDLRGNGHSSLRASRKHNFGYAALVEFDLPAAITTIKRHYPDAKLVLLGHSLGGQASTLYLSHNQDITDDLILAASCSVYYRNWPSSYKWGLLFFSQFAWLISVLFGYFPGRRLGFGGREARGVMQDWAYNARTGNYKLANSRLSYHPFPSISNLNVLAINFDDDQLAPVKATDHLLSKISPASITKLSMSGDDIGRTSANHFNWLRSPKNVAKNIVQHLQS